MVPGAKNEMKKITDNTREKVLYGRRMAWDVAGCAAHAGVRRAVLMKWLEAGSDCREAIDSGRIKTLPRRGGLERACLDLWDAWERDSTHAERRLQAIAARSAEGHWTPDHRWIDTFDPQGNPILDAQGRAVRVRVPVEPKWIPPNPGVAIDMLERLFPARWRKAPASVVNVTQDARTAVVPFVDLTDASPKQLAALMGHVDPEEVLGDED